MVFGRQTERRGRRERSNTLPRSDGAEGGGRSSRRRGQQPGRRGPGRRDYPHVSVVEEWHELPEQERVCPRCRQPRRALPETEDSEQLEVEVRAHRRVIRRRRYVSTCVCPDQPRTVTAPLAPKLIPKSRYGISVWVHLLIEKYWLQRPLERTLGALELQGLSLPAGTVTGGEERPSGVAMGVQDRPSSPGVAGGRSVARGAGRAGGGGPQRGSHILYIPSLESIPIFPSYTFDGSGFSL